MLISYVFFAVVGNIKTFLNFCFSRFKETFSLKLSMLCSNLIKYTLVNKDEIFTLSPYLIPPEFKNS